MAVTLNMRMFDNIRGNMTQGMIDQINQSQSLTQKLTEYNSLVENNNALAIGDSNGNGSFNNYVNGKIQIMLSSSDLWGQTGAQPVVYTEQGTNTQHIITREADFVGVLAHEVGHWKYKSIDDARLTNIDRSQPGTQSNLALSQVYAEGEADYFNWISRKEILDNGGPEIELRGANYSGSGFDLDYQMNLTSRISLIAGDSQSVMEARMAAAGANSQVHLNTSTNGQNYWEYYKYNGQSAPMHVNTSLIDSNSDGIIDNILEEYANGTSELTLLNSHSFNSAYPSTNGIVNLQSGANAYVNGNHITVNAGRGSNVTIGGNGQFSNDSLVNQVNAFAGATVHTDQNSRTNIIVQSWDGTGGIYAGNNSNVGVYSAGTSGVLAAVHGGNGGTNLWVGGNKNSSIFNVMDMHGGTVTVVDNSSVLFNNSAGNPSAIYVDSNSAIKISNNTGQKIYLRGNHTQVDDYGMSDSIYNNGSDNLINLRGTQINIYNAGQNAHTNSWGSGNHVYNQSNYSIVWRYDSTTTISNTGSNNTTNSQPDTQYYYFWGFGGSKEKVNSQLIATSSSTTDLLKSLASENANDVAINHSMDTIKQVVNINAPINLTGARWAGTTITWSIGTEKDTAKTQYEGTIKQAFETWSSLSGITFSQAKTGETADVSIDWKNLDTNNTGALGLTEFSVDSNGLMKSGSHIYLEDPTINSIIKNIDGSLIYTGTDSTLEQVLLHEIGHILGLGSNASPTSIENYFLDSSNRNISSADLESIYEIYPELNHSPAKIIGPEFSDNYMYHAI